MSYSHRMPFGAEVLANCHVRFRLWAPKAQTVSVALSTKSPPMNRQHGGWFELVTNEALPGSQYQFLIDQGRRVPDPGSRFQPSGVHGPSEVIDPCAYRWEHDWHGRPWEEAVLYEMHVGAFSVEGTFAAAERKLDYLAGLGITAIEIMPVSSFPGKRNWGYDGVLPYAPTDCYGRPEDFKHFIDAAHSKNLMVMLDVVYNHFGPEGNYLHLYAPQFFTDRHKTPWGQAINVDGPDGRTVRDYFIHNALYWLEEYCLDGLRFDAVNAILDDSRPDILTELAERVRKAIGKDRFVHLVLENDNNAAHYLSGDADSQISGYTAQWNDDFHHAAHVLLTHESDGYYADYSANPAWHLGRCLAEGFAYQGEASHYRGGKLRGESSGALPPGCFISFLQNHDQVGNRALGERITSLADPAALKAMLAVFLLAPSPPLLFMGEEFGASTPFLFFCDFGPELAPKVTEGRREEFSRFAQFNSEEVREKIPDPNKEETFLRSKLDWSSLGSPPHSDWLGLYHKLLALRQSAIVPHIKNIQSGKAQFEVLGPKALSVVWPLTSGGKLHLLANFAAEQREIRTVPEGSLLYTTADDRTALPKDKAMPPVSAAWFLAP
jgi:maltooligosyltrehalose trehalohydrolase